jgi:serine/threonine protein kinase
MTNTDSPGSSAVVELRAGDVLAGKYELVQPLAVGGMGSVWTARNIITGAEVAAKVLLPTQASPDGLARFRREAQATAALAHRGIVRVFDLVELDPERGSLVMIMERLRGQTLAREIAELGCLSVHGTLDVVLPILSALSHAHGLGIVHRDLKPENIFLALEPDGQRMPKLVDFGISKLLWQHPITLDGHIMGTLGYMSPEQTLGSAVDRRSDLFSVGVLLYECLSGKNPFHESLSGGTYPRDLMSLFQVEERPLDHVPPALWRVIRRALARSATDRFESAADLADALRRAVPGHELAQDRRSSSLPPPLARVVRAGGAQRVFAGAILALLAALTVASAAPATRPQVRHGVDASEGRSRSLHAKYTVSHVDAIHVSANPAVDAGGAPEAVSTRAARSVGAKKRMFGMEVPARRPLADNGAELVLRDPGF